MDKKTFVEKEEENIFVFSFDFVFYICYRLDGNL